MEGLPDSGRGSFSRLRPVEGEASVVVQNQPAVGYREIKSDQTNILIRNLMRQQQQQKNRHRQEKRRKDAPPAKKQRT